MVALYYLTEIKKVISATILVFCTKNRVLFSIYSDFLLFFCYWLHLKPYLSAAKSSCKFAIGSPLQANTPALNGNPAAACGYTSTPCGVCFLSNLEENF